MRNLIVWLILLASCAAYSLPDVPEIPAGSYAELAPDLSRVRSSCVHRVNIAAHTSNEGRQHAALWQMILGVLGGISTGAGILFAVRYAKNNAAPSQKSATPPVVAAVFSALSAIIAPLVATRDKADKLSAEYQSLRAALENGDDAAKSEEKVKLYRECAAGHPDFVTPVADHE